MFVYKLFGFIYFFDSLLIAQLLMKHIVVNVLTREFHMSEMVCLISVCTKHILVLNGDVHPR